MSVLTVISNHLGFTERTMIRVLAAGIVDKGRIAFSARDEHDDTYSNVTCREVRRIDIQGAANSLIFAPGCHQTGRCEFIGKETLVQGREGREPCGRVPVLDIRENGLGQFSVCRTDAMNLFPPLTQRSGTDPGHTPDDRQPQADANKFMGMLQILKIGKRDQDQTPGYSGFRKGSGLA